MNKEQSQGQTEKLNPVGSSGWLDNLSTHNLHFCDPPGTVTFRTIDNTGVELAEMDDYPGAMAVLVESLQREGVRFKEADFKDGDIIHRNKHVTIIRGEAAEFLHREYERIECRLPAQKWFYTIRNLVCQWWRMSKLKVRKVVHKCLTTKLSHRPTDESTGKKH